MGSEIITTMDDTKHHFNTKMVLTVCGISCGAISYSYAGSVVGTTLGTQPFVIESHVVLTKIRRAAVFHLLHGAGHQS